MDRPQAPARAHTGAARTIATICARGGSKGLPGKNIRDFHGKPLIVHTIEQALACPQIDVVYVSTDDAQIADIARGAGALVPYLRPAELAQDSSAKLPVLAHLLAWLEAQGLAVTRLVDLQPTSPLRMPADISRALALDPQGELVVSVSEAQANPYFNLVEQAADGHVHLSKGNGAGRRQDTPAVYALNGSIYVWQPAALRRAAVEGLWSAKILPYVMPAWQSVDIDNLEDFEYAEWLFQRHRGHAA
ncbi:MAG: acylneuraminate cytidylyltransferase family protein [Polaromonas sp.]|nr:acylneuraminate cytidylyltransferase family protein [Polaromonas sp.]